jgi:RNA polymerase sigma-70 factor (ECF subfamily)
MSGKEQTELTEQKDIIDHLNDFSDEQLALETRAGSTRAFELLVRRYTSRLFQFLRHRLPTDQDAEDITQDAFMKAYQNIDRYDSQWKFSTWIYTIASRLAISHYRSNKKSARDISLTDSSQPIHVTAPDPGPQDSLMHSRETQNLWRVAATLKPAQYQVLWLRYGEDMKIKDIAEVMNKSQLHVRVLLHRARLKLSGLFTGETSGNEAADMPTEPSAPLPTLTFLMVFIIICLI